MAKTHYKVDGVDYRENGQTEFEFSHQAACGYVRDRVTENGDDVDCSWCLASIYMINHHTIKNTTQENVV